MSRTGTNSLKGRSLNEKLGIDKANQLKEAQSKLALKLFKGKTYLEICGSIEKVKQRKEKYKKAMLGKISKLKGKTYLQIHGSIEKVKQRKEKFRKSKLGKSCSLEGKTWEQIYGKEKADKRKKAFSLMCLGKKHSIKTLKKIVNNKLRNFLYNNFKFRSSWEIYFVQWCDKNNIKWEYEPKIFDLGQFHYIPDFYLPKFNLWVEVKGRWLGNSKLKCKLFKEKISNLLWIIDDSNYSFLHKKFKNKIKEYNSTFEEYLVEEINNEILGGTYGEA